MTYRIDTGEEFDVLGNFHNYKYQIWYVIFQVHVQRKHEILQGNPIKNQIYY